jgi:vacuolar-type H+-ATPase subunit C/Vma6
MELLRKRLDPGYPTEYLLSRIKGRRSRLIGDWRPLLFDPALYESLPTARTGSSHQDRTADAVWRNLMAEYQWVYSQMNQQLRDIFFSYFLFTELKTIVICLRHLDERKAGAVDALFDRSLLSDEVKKVLLFGFDLPAVVSGIERLFLSLSDRFLGLRKTLDSGKLRAVEQRLIGTYLSVMIESDLHRPLKMFFSRLIDARNIMGLYKYLRLGFKVQPVFISGGAIPEMRLKNIIKTDDLRGVALLVHEWSGITVDRPDSTSVELALYRGMTRWMRKEGRDPFGIAPILDYLWRCSIEAMNLSVLHHTKDLDREAVAAELVQ